MLSVKEVKEGGVNLVNRLEIKEIKRWAVVCPMCGYENLYEWNPMDKGATHIKCEYCDIVSALRD